MPWCGGPRCSAPGTRPGRSAGGARRGSACDRGAPGAGCRRGARRPRSSAEPGRAVRTILVPAAWKTASNETVKFDPRSRTRNLMLSNRSPRVRARLRACCTVQSPVGCAVTPPRCIRRVLCSMNTSTYSRFSSTVSTCRKSTARIPAAWACRNCRHVGPERRGAGSMPAAQAGAEVTGVGSTAKVDMVRILGADHVIGYTRDDITAGGHRYDVILDTGGHRPLSQLRRALALYGTLVIVGSEDGGRWLGGSDRQLRALMRSPFTSQPRGMLTGRAARLPRHRLSSSRGDSLAWLPLRCRVTAPA